MKGPQTSAQGDLVEDAERASVAAESPAPEVSQTLGEAAGQMKKSEQSLAIGQNDPLAQQAALDALIQAENQLREEIRETEEAKKALELLEEIRGNLDEVISDQQELQRDTIDEVADPAEVTSAELAGRQDQLGEEVRQLGLQTQSPAPLAAEDLGQAAEAMESARKSLEDVAPLKAQPEQGDALAALLSARQNLNESIEDLQKQLGELPASGEAGLAEARAAIEHAQGQVSEALSDLEENTQSLDAVSYTHLTLPTKA